MAAGGELEEGVVDIDQMGRSIQLLLLLLLLGMPSSSALLALLGLCLLLCVPVPAQYLCVNVVFFSLTKTNRRTKSL